MKNVNLYIDYDGVLVAFEKATYKLFDREYDESTYPQVYDISEALGISVGLMWKRIDLEGSSFWANLETYPWTVDLIKLCKDYCKANDTDWRILSSPSMAPSCASGKTMSFQKLFGRHFRKYILCPAASKKLLCHSWDDVLIDDRESTINDWRERGGLGILFPQPWNSNRGIKDRVNYVSSQLRASVYKEN